MRYVLLIAILCMVSCGARPAPVGSATPEALAAKIVVCMRDHQPIPASWHWHVDDLPQELQRQFTEAQADMLRNGNRLVRESGDPVIAMVDDDGDVVARTLHAVGYESSIPIRKRMEFRWVNGGPIALFVFVSERDGMWYLPGFRKL